MTSIRKILAIMAALCLISCQKDDTLQYFNTTMGNFSGGLYEKAFYSQGEDWTCEYTLNTTAWD